MSHTRKSKNLVQLWEAENRKAARCKKRDPLIDDPAAREREFLRHCQSCQVHQAILEDRAYLETAFGLRKVTSYDDQSGWATTNNVDCPTDRRSFLVGLYDIKWEPAQ